MEIRNFRSIKISLASPDKIKSWSYGEVTKPETINYRRLRPEKDGLFDEAIFGPTKDWQCYCGKYKKIRYRGIICDKCGVEVTRSRVRRERMGHIGLAAPVAHIWYTQRVPSYLGLMLDISRRNLDRILYYAQFIISEVDEEARVRALKHLDERMVKELREIEAQIKEKVTAADGQLNKQTTRLQSKVDNIRKRYEEKLATQTDELVSEAAAAQRRLNEALGRTVRKEIVFEPTRTMLVDKGEVVKRSHLQSLTKIVQSEVEEIEAQIREQEKKEITPLQEEMERLKAESGVEIEKLRHSRDEEAQAIRNRYQEERDLLKGLKVMQFLNEAQVRELEDKWGRIFKAEMGGEALLNICKNIDLEVMGKELRREIRITKSKQRRRKAIKRLRVVESLRKSGNRPEWMVLTILPVIPPDLRPMVQLDGGRFATSDLNDLYRRVINRNNRLKRLLELGAPEVIIRNEKRMLQEAVDSLIDNSRRGKAVSVRGARKLKSLSDMLKGKQGRFRRNLLGKRVDYSGRSVIVIGPHLKLHQCGLPKGMALELFKPFVMRKLVEYNYAHNVRGAKRIIEQKRPEVWEVLEEVIKDYPILLNRAPTLHRLGIQAFQPVLVEGNAIQIHPLVCDSYNADFDGDQMAVHVPLSESARREAKELMMSTYNLFLPSNGEPTVGPTKDMVLGCYYLTVEREGVKGEGKYFADLDEVLLAYDLGTVDLHAKIKVRTKAEFGKSDQNEVIETTVGRCIFNSYLPQELRFQNQVFDKTKLKALVSTAYQLLGLEGTAKMVDAIKDLGFRYATRSGTTIAIGDLTIPRAKQEILERIGKESDEIQRQYRRGLITENEQYIKTVELWTGAMEEVTEAVSRELDPYGPIQLMATSGATKGGFQPVRQMAGMRGLMADPAGRIIALPIRSNFREGLTALEFFISTHGARKGLADTALRTADAGYLTRRLVDVAQENIVNAENCGTTAGIWVRASEGEEFGARLRERIIGRIAAQNIQHPQNKTVLVKRGQLIELEEAKAIEEARVSEAYIRSVLTCQLRHGVCAMCYGKDLARGGLVKMGQAVGIIAAQSIGEPGTQLTLRTFHTGGVAEEDITHGLPRVQELFEARNPKGQAIMSDIDGLVEITEQEGVRKLKVWSNEIFKDEYPIPGNHRLQVEEDQMVEAGTVLASRGEPGSPLFNQVVAAEGGKVQIKEKKIVIQREKYQEVEYELSPAARILVNNGQRAKAGDQITEGSKNPNQILRVLGREAVQAYLLDEVQKVYRSQGVNINDKHIEMIIRMMLAKVRVRNPGDSEYLLGELVDRIEFEETVNRLVEQGKTPPSAQPVLLGITKAALNTSSFLSASSFQHTINVLAQAAIEGRVDELRGLKENVIIGKLIPAGTGFPTTAPEEEEPSEVAVAAG
ncbi:MAG: DNA-directed RNA polymerase subunit beta' [Chloroflexi bacterium]|nr:DNA-directed RNA polymerase subunit beta' [Chloroflexota bacterium]